MLSARHAFSIAVIGLSAQLFSSAVMKLDHFLIMAL